MAKKEWSNLAKTVYKRTYSRDSESWPNTVERVIKGNISSVDPEYIEPGEPEKLEKFLSQRKAGPAGRGWWYSGSPSHERLGGVALNNCWFLTADKPDSFVLAQDLLMLGGGVGLSVEHRFVTQLPHVKPGVNISHDPTKDADFIVPDSREGWNELLRRVLDSFFISGSSFSYSTLVVRGAGEPINGFGGTSSGPLPLVNCVRNICSIINARAGKHIRPIDAADILCCIADMVVSGNVRRSALIILGDPWDKEFIRSKRFDLGSVPSYRARANFSVVASDVDDLHPSFWKTYEHGEPFGIVNRRALQSFGRFGDNIKDTALGVNPCQPGFATVLTPDGIRRFDEVGFGDTVWSGKQWAKIKNKWETGVKPVYKYQTPKGVFIGTENHKIFQKGERVEVGEADYIDRCVGPKQPHGEIHQQDVIDGLVVGDGSVHKASNNLVHLYIGNKDKEYFEDPVANKILGERFGISPKAYEVETTIRPEELPRTYARWVPERFKKGTHSVVRGFLRGLFSANGSVVANRITLKQTSKILVQDVQEMLSSLGIRSYWTTNRSKENQFANGKYALRESYDLNITTDRDLFKNQIGFIQKYKQDKIITKESKPKNEFGEIKEIEYLGKYLVYDIEVEAEEHSYWTGGCLVSNCAEATLEPNEPCNLQEIWLPNLRGPDEFMEAARLMHRWGKRVTCEKYHHENIQEVVRRNRRIGTGITGCLQSELFKADVLDSAYAVVAKENESYSKQIGIHRSIRTTTIKPSGTLSILGDTTPGIHPGFSRHYIRRVRFSASDTLLPLLKEAGHKVEPEQKFDGTLNHDTQVVDFYMETPSGTPCADKDWDTWKQLDTLLFAQEFWSDQAVSVTVYYHKKEIPQIKEWLRENIHRVKSVSFLPLVDHDFAQAPIEAITEDQYNKLIAKIKDIDINSVLGGELADSLECEGASCPVK